MDKHQIFQKLITNHYKIELILECLCDFEWGLIDGSLSYEIGHENFSYLNRLSVDGVIIAEYDYNGNRIDTYEGFFAKDIPDIVREALVKDYSLFPNVNIVEEHDEFRKAGTLAGFIEQSGYVAEMHNDFFLLVYYDDGLASSWEDNHEWADRFLSATGPLVNGNAYFIFVDNSNLITKCSPI